MRISPLAGHPAPPERLVDVPGLIAAYHDDVLDPAVAGQGVVFGTSGHRGSSFHKTFNEWPVLAITQAICRYRSQQGFDGPLFLGVDTHALSGSPCTSALEVLAANGVEVVLAEHDEYTPTPAVSHAILTYNHGPHGGDSRPSSATARSGRRTRMGSSRRCSRRRSPRARDTIPARSTAS